MVKILKPILLVFIKSKAMKRLIVDLLKAIAKQTDNTIDDQAVAFIESRMFPSHDLHSILIQLLTVSPLAEELR